MDQISWDTWLSELEMEKDPLLREKNSDQDNEELSDGECFLRDILQDHPSNLCSNSKAILAPTTTVAADGGATTHSAVGASETTTTTTTTPPPTTCVLSFDKSIVMPEILEDPCYYHYNSNNENNSYQIKDNSLKPKRSIDMINDEPPVSRGTKKSRSGAEATDHIMAERRRRQELTERFMSLSATIPGLKKIDKATILSEAISYVKQLQERVKDLEQETKNNMTMEKPHHDSVYHNNIPSPAIREVNSDNEVDDTPNYNNNNDVLPEVKARISDNKQVLIRILCKKQKSTMVKILDQLKSLHLNIFGNSVMPFGTSTLDITIIAQMSEEYSVSVKDLVKSLRIALKCNGDAC